MRSSIPQTPPHRQRRSLPGSGWQVTTLVLCCLLLSSRPGLAQAAARHQIQWHHHTIQTNQPMPSLAPALTMAEAPGTGPAYYFVQLTGPVTRDMKQQIAAAGGELLDYVPSNSFLVRMTPAARERVQGLAIVQWTGLFQPGYRLAAPLLEAAEKGRLERPTPLTDATVTARVFKPGMSAGTLLSTTPTPPTGTVQTEHGATGGQQSSSPPDRWPGCLPTVRSAAFVSLLRPVPATSTAGASDPPLACAPALALTSNWAPAGAVSLAPTFLTSTTMVPTFVTSPTRSAFAGPSDGAHPVIGA